MSSIIKKSILSNLLDYAEKDLDIDIFLEEFAEEPSKNKCINSFVDNRAYNLRKTLKKVTDC